MYATLMVLYTHIPADANSIESILSSLHAIAIAAEMSMLLMINATMAANV